MIKVKIDGSIYQAKPGATILEIARENDIYIPTLCDDSRLEPYGGCRLCIVQIKGIARPVTACTTPATDGMEITTTNDYIEDLRKTIVELILSDHPNDCMVCEKSGDCSLQELAYFYGIRTNPYWGERRRYTTKDNNPFIERDMEKCILCGKCVRVCNEVQGVGAIDIAYRGFNSKITPPFEKDLNCEFCGQCVSICPTGALIGKSSLGKGRQKDIKKIETICVYCGCGCNITLHVSRNQVIKVSSRPDTINEGWLCVKGRFGFEFINSPERLKKPLIRIKPKASGKEIPVPNINDFKEVTWYEAIDHVATRLREIKEKYGPDSIAGLSSARCTNEENYLFQKFFRAVIGTNNIDHCARYCHSASVAGLATVFGSGAMTNSIPEIENNDVLFVIGSNTKENHPIVALKMIKAVKKGAKLIVADPRKISLVRFAHIWLQHRPGTDVALLNSMAYVIVKEGLIKKDFIERLTKGLTEDFIKNLEEYPPEVGEKITGVSKEKIIEAARLYSSASRAGIYYTMGITQHSHGTDNVLGIANLALLTGNLGKESAGVNPLRGQNNVQGATDMGCSPDMYPGYQKVTIPSIRRRFEELWGVQLPEKEGLTASEMIFGVEAGILRAMYIMGENPVLSDPDTLHTISALKNLEFLVVQDIFLTETAALADVVLPAACFAEKDGTFTNTERRVQRLRKAVNPPVDAKDDIWIISEISKRLGYNMNYYHPEEVWNEIGMAWPAVAGITYLRLERGGIQWPCPTTDHPGTPYLFKGGFPRGKATFTVVKYKPSCEEPDNEYPYILTTGRMLFQYHTGSMTRRIKAIETVAGEPYIEINPEDAERLNIKNGEMVRVSSRRGSVIIKAMVINRPEKGIVFIPFHFREAAANILTDSLALDPLCKIPELKVSAVKIEKIK